MTPLDQVPLLAVLGFSLVVQLLCIEAGFWYGRRGHKGVKAQLAQVRAIMGAALGLAAFMLAFSFTMAQQHFEQRTQAYMMEVSAIDSAFRGADLLDDDARVAAQDLLKEFAKLRLRTSKAAQSASTELVVELIRESERMHDVLWALAEQSMEDDGERADKGIFAQAVLAMISAHDARLQAALFNRISPVIWVTLLLMAGLSMVVMGFQAGLTGTRSSLATWAVALIFSAILTLITDLDRPRMTLFHLNQDLMVELEARMEQSTDASGSEARR
jgi:hypothetical protein